MNYICVIYEQDDDRWVANSPEVQNWTVVADTYEEAHRLGARVCASRSTAWTST